MRLYCVGLVHYANSCAVLCAHIFNNATMCSSESFTLLTNQKSVHVVHNPSQNKDFFSLHKNYFYYQLIN